MLKKLLPVVCLVLCVTVSQAQTISTGTMTSPLCPGTAVTVPFTSSGTFGSGNTFTAQLSNSSGSFSSPVTIGTLSPGSVTGTYNGSISATVPANATGGLDYHIRVISSSPAVTGSSNSSNIAISALPPSPTNSASNTICQGSSTQLTASDNGYNISWWNAASGGTDLASGNNYTVSPTANTTYYSQASFVQSGTQTFNYSGSTTMWIVPPGIYSINVDVAGASGSYGGIDNDEGEEGEVFTPGPNGGEGGEVQATYAVIPGDTLYITVGGAGSCGDCGQYGGFNGGGSGGYTGEDESFFFGGGGGGASDIRFGGTALVNRIFVAGGGGGASAGAAGGSGGVSLSSGTLGQGGNAGNANGSESGNAEGGGGGGYYGGSIGFGGSGGSSYADPSATNVTNTVGDHGGNGYVTITYSGNLSCVSAARTPVTVSVNQPPTTATVALDTMVVCGSLTSGSLGGNTPTVGAGVWTQTSGLGTTIFSNASSGSSTATVSQPGIYVYTWTISNAPCPSSAASITVNYYSSIPAVTTLTATPSTACPGQTVELNATSPGNLINWWSAPNGGTNLNTDTSGANYAVAPTSTNTYYAQAQLVAVDSRVFSYTGSQVSWVVPAGVDSITVDVQGAAGGNYTGSYDGAGGAGGRVQATYAVSAGQTLYINVGGMGGTGTSAYYEGGFNGGGYGYPASEEFYGGGAGGGGASDIRIGGTDVTNRIFVGGGGGGEGLDNAGDVYFGNNGGAGGGLTGGNGNIGDFPTTIADGGTQLAGGQGGGESPYCAGYLAYGGAECYGEYGGGGGGGGGYYGGGAGSSGGSGGAGSGYADPTANGVVFTSGYQTGNGQVIISYAHPVQCFSALTPVTVTIAQIPAPLIATGGPTTFCSGDSVMLSVNKHHQIDVSETALNLGTIGNDQWQSFVPGLAGYTTGIAVSTNGCPNQGVTFSLYSGVGVGGTLIYTANATLSGCNTWYTFNIPYSAAVNLTPGQNYTFRIQGSGIQLIANTSGYGSYYSDEYGLNPGWELDFMTIVTPLSYPVQWYNNNVLIPGATDSVYTASTAGLYSCQNVSGSCTSGSSNAISVTVNPLPVVGITGVNAACNAVTLTASGGNSYAWNGGNSANTAGNTFNSSATYAVTVTDNNGCTDTASQLVTIYPAVIAGIIGNPAACSPDTLTATGGTAYAWSGGNSPDSATNNFTSSGTYNVIVSNSYGCSSTASQLVTIYPAATAGITGTASACNEVTLTASGGTSYAWNGGNSGNSAANSFITGGTYTVTVTNSSGCTDTASQLVTIYPAVNAAITGNSTACGSDTLTATGGTAYAWNGGNSSDSATNNFANSGTYSVTVSNSYGCSSSISQQVTIYAAPLVGITGTASSCNPVILTAGGGSTYVWSGGSSPGASTDTFATSGAYTVTVSNSNGCSSTASQLVTIYPAVTAGITGAVAGCNAVTLTATGGASYTWSGGSSPNNAGNTFTSGGPYSVTVTSSNGCSASTSAIVTVYSTPVASITGDISACGSITLTAGTGLTYTWNGGNSINSAINTFDNSGTYTVTVSNGGTCTATASKSITVNPNPTVVITGSGTGCGSSVSLTASGGTSYRWSAGEHVKNATNIFTSSGIYTITVTGANGCPASLSKLITLLPPPVAAITGNVETCGPLALTAMGGNTYRWSGGSSINTAIDTFSANGTYRVTVTDANDCTASASAAVHLNERPSTPGLISGPASASNCEGMPELTYSIATVPLAAYYKWTISHKATFAAPDTSNSVNVNYAGATVGNAVIKVEAVNSCGSSAASSATININHDCAAKDDDEMNTGGTAVVQLHPYLKAYPNPAVGQLRIDFGAVANEQYTFRFYDVLGNGVLSAFYMAEEGDNTRDFDLSNLSKGVYFIKVSAESVGVNTLRIVVQ